MDDQNIYKEADVELTQVPPVIGGWLRFLKIICITKVVVVAIATVLSVIFYFAGKELFDTPADFIAALAESLPILIFSVLILKFIHIRNEAIPTKIYVIIFSYMATSAVIYFISLYLFNSGYLTEEPTRLIGDVIYTLVWTAYFKKSKRVKSYYGANANV
ncbi:DUF2569 family protein [Psychromonas aquimarina]|uniref:DUF2569 family protein n=1 Tax=Psychromonas aquimarina TaxID=444919 RepID=UPI00048FD66D|nr:DUF2569 family protein [Psychromonas aquimarina]